MVHSIPRIPPWLVIFVFEKQNDNLLDYFVLNQHFAARNKYVLKRAIQSTKKTCSNIKCFRTTENDPILIRCHNPQCNEFSDGIFQHMRCHHNQKNFQHFFQWWCTRFEVNARYYLYFFLFIVHITQHSTLTTIINGFPCMHNNSINARNEYKVKCK